MRKWNCNLHPGTTCDGVVLDAYDGKPLPGAPLVMNFHLPEDLNFGLKVCTHYGREWKVSSGKCDARRRRIHGAE